MQSRTPQLILYSRNPYLWVSAVRDALRRSGNDRHEIARFSEEAMADGEPEAIRSVCARWAAIEVAEGLAFGAGKPRQDNDAQTT